MSRDRRPQAFAPELSAALEARELMAAHVAMPAPAPAEVLPAPVPAASGPHVASTQLIVSGRSVTGVAVTFSEAMAPASVSNVHNYFLYNVTGRTSGDTAHPIRLRSASYNPATDTVTLIPAARLKPSATYFITNVDLNNKLRTAADVERANAQSSFADVNGELLVDFGSPSGGFADPVTRVRTAGQLD